MKKITLLIAVLISAMSFGQTIANNWVTGLESPNTCNIEFDRLSVVDNTVTITTNSKDIQYFNVSWIFKGTDGKNKKVPGSSTIAQILSTTGTGFSIDGLNTTAADGVLSLGNNPCTAVTGAKIFASIKFTAFNDDANLTTSTLTVTTNPADALGDAIKYVTSTFDVVINYDANLSTRDLESFNFSYAPNPARNTINLSAAKNINKVEVFNMLGQKSKSIELNTLRKTVNISDLPAGIYIMQVTIGEAIGSYKIMKQ